MTTAAVGWVALALGVGIVAGGADRAADPSRQDARSGTKASTNQAPSAAETAPADGDEKKTPERESEPGAKPRPSFKPKEQIPVDQGVDFPVDI